MRERAASAQEILMNRAIQQTSNNHSLLRGNVEHPDVMITAGRSGIMLDGGLGALPQWSSPKIRVNPGISDFSTTKWQIISPEAPSEKPGTHHGALPRRVPSTGPNNVPAQLGEEQLSHAVAVVQNIKQFIVSRLGAIPLCKLPDDQRMEYNHLLELIYKMTEQLENQLPMYYIVLGSEPIIRMLTAIILLVAHQRACCPTELLQHSLSLYTLKRMYLQVHKAKLEFEQKLPMMEVTVRPQQGCTGPHINHPSLTAPNDAPSAQALISHTSPLNSSEIVIPDLTALITRCSLDPVCGGTYGNIYRCTYHGPEGDVGVAVKAIRPQFISAEVFRRELGIWKRLRHSNILKFMGTTSDFGPSVALVAPWMVNGTLTSFLDQNGKSLTLLYRLLLLHDIAAGLHYLHTFTSIEDGHADLLPVVHGDLTGANVLIGSDRRAYLADFGLSGTLKKLTGMTYLVNMSCRPGALRWTAPELLSGEESASANTQSDIYSFGCIILQVLTGNVPWSHLTSDTTILLRVVEGKPHPRPDDDCVTDQHWNFVTSCWSTKPVDRPSAEETLQFVERMISLFARQIII
ncbi:kinase-like protein [Rhizopogon vinicolor AM-OR11-026]|uniref:Kinase-like protein n=1 Tax=Rhizopogon vinicolor AM-OR11-026 TaxID=1314800 RepID=A0A1B7MP92_9AGAM|nr:kinase-like protein [Rhizopogon vinicolor AM-OR11-026]